MKACILSIGDELMSGNTVDTNAAYLSRQLLAAGIEPVLRETVGDNRSAVAEAIVRAASRADVVLVTGGLGPTADDVTRGALADAMGTELEMDERCLADLEEFFRCRHREMVVENRVQAMIPRGAWALPNPIGTAPGLAAKIGRAGVFVMPGVPREMVEMFETGVRPALPASGRAIRQIALHTFGAGESNVFAMIRDLMSREGDVTVGTTISEGLVTVWVTSRAGTEEDAERQALEVVEPLKERLGEIVIGEGKVTMASVVGQLLRERKQTLATGESCTGGLIGELITQVSGASEYYLGGVVAYDNAVKERLLEVPAPLLAAHGAVSEAVVAAMAEGVRRKTGADWGLAVTGIAGPAGGTREKPVGLVYTALAGGGGTKVAKAIVPGDRPLIRQRAAMAAMNMVRLALAGARKG
ncbi:MAG: competence/damage-inducible protein A [Planctomycetota bacterium]|nr:competence/damage-inducible protein A [Planctomycetota bacterium]